MRSGRNDRNQLLLQRHVYDAVRSEDHHLLPVGGLFSGPWQPGMEVDLLSRLYHVADLGSLDADGLGGGEMETVC